MTDHGVSLRVQVLAFQMIRQFKYGKLRLARLLLLVNQNGVGLLLRLKEI